MAKKGPEGTTARVEVLSGIGGGLITGFAVGLSVLFLERGFVAAQERAAWRANVEIAESIPGFTPGKRSLEGMHFAGKRLKDADFRNLDLHGVSFRDTELLGARFDGANLRGADFTNADLETAIFGKADLSKALLLGSNLGRADMAHVKSVHEAQVNTNTCWPPSRFQGFRNLKMQTTPMPRNDDQGTPVKGWGTDGPCPDWTAD
ncbi:pentapeptide repeat-containing protein [Streptomyces sp. NBC_00464]|uniref:pentapeptide repeat-containing protein n=1 Tax=Streptomyces sp. NBC_00464 TaxID=2975751 RepID=UPI002E18A1C3